MAARSGSVRDHSAHQGSVNKLSGEGILQAVICAFEAGKVVSICPHFHVVPACSVCGTQSQMNPVAKQPTAADIVFLTGIASLELRT